MRMQFSAASPRGRGWPRLNRETILAELGRAHLKMSRARSSLPRGADGCRWYTEHRSRKIGSRSSFEIGSGKRPLLLLACIALVCSTALAQSQQGGTGTGTGTSAASGDRAAATPARAHYQPNRFAGRAGKYYELVWGVDSLAVKTVESGELIRFTYRVLDADKAKVLNDKKSEPALYAPRAGVKLVVPSMEKIGQLRQSATPEAGKSYWMTFSNKGRLVKPGDHVAVVIGQFRAEGLVVD